MPDRSSIMVSMNKLSAEKRCAVVSALVEGFSIRNTVRITGVAKNTVTKLLVDQGNRSVARNAGETVKLTHYFPSVAIRAENLRQASIDRLRLSRTSPLMP